ncbi:hypothetical protein GLOIN_2v1785920 [Rhizophagus irregularis DAOM 181602=DAOM 197198]|nr:hypothetical protein GLOIN_2v1785920 [Rhizophagus irregularis DAOM 181602=DAOM 197198]
MSCLDLKTKLKNFVEDELFLTIGIAKKKTISIKTAIRWLRVLGYSFQQYHHGIYYNGYERKDMLQYQKELLEKIFDHENYMSKYEGEFIDQICPNLPERGKKRVLVVHDECIFYSNDRKCEL